MHRNAECNKNNLKTTRVASHLVTSLGRKTATKGSVLRRVTSRSFVFRRKASFQNSRFELGKQYFFDITCFVLCCVVSCCFVFVSSRVVSCRVVLCYVVWCCATLCRVRSCCVVLRFVVFCVVVLVTCFDNFGCHVHDIFDVFVRVYFWSRFLTSRGSKP